jgi:hypothetical protein
MSVKSPYASDETLAILLMRSGVKELGIGSSWMEVAITTAELAWNGNVSVMSQGGPITWNGYHLCSSIHSCSSCSARYDAFSTCCLWSPPSSLSGRKSVNIAAREDILDAQPVVGALMRFMPSACSARPRRSVAVFSSPLVTPAVCMRPASVVRSPTAASAASLTFPRKRSPMPCAVWTAPLHTQSEHQHKQSREGKRRT